MIKKSKNRKGNDKSVVTVTTEVQSLLVPNGALRVTSVTLQLSRVTSRSPVTAISKCDGTVVTGYGRSTVTAGSGCEVQLSRVTGAHRMMSTCVEIR